MSKDENNSDEVTMVYNLDDHIVHQEFGDSKEIDILANTEIFHMLYSDKECIVMLLHNHPSHNSFSTDDIQFFLEHDKIRAMTVVNNDGKVHYMVKEDEYDSKEAYAICREVCHQYKDGEYTSDVEKYLTISKNILENFYRCGILYN